MIAFADVAVTILAIALEALEDKPARVFVAPGSSVAWDECCDGQLSVRLVSATALYASGSRCPYGWQLTLGVQLLRCTTALGPAGEAPSAEVLSGEATALMNELQAIVHALLCTEVEALHKLTVTTMSTAGPQGGCVGGEALVSVVI